jgi:hypothetical protein
MKSIGALIFALTVLASPAALAGQTPKAVVELYTSQGCSSCPPADARLAELSRKSGIVALTLHVDYWDYLGWKDTLARPEFSERQRAYSHIRGDRGVYTPQMIVNGVHACVGSDDGKIDVSIQNATSEHARLPVPVAVSREGNLITVEIAGDVAGTSSAGEVLLLTVQSRVTVEIERGENKGRKATYVNVVREISHVGTWKGGRARFETMASDAGDNFVVLVHETNPDGPGPIIGAAKGAGL